MNQAILLCQLLIACPPVALASQGSQAAPSELSNQSNGSVRVEGIDLTTDFPFLGSDTPHNYPLRMTLSSASLGASLCS